MTVKRTQIGIIGAGPAGLMLARLLMEQGISSVILEAKTRKYVENRIRAGVLESGTVELLNRAQADYRLKVEGQTHEGLELSINGQRSRIDLKRYSKGKSVTIYGQTELTIDLINIFNLAIISQSYAKIYCVSLLISIQLLIILDNLHI